MQSEFISSISHELRTPLTAITGWSETLMFDTAIQGDSRRGIAIISKEAARLTSLVEELLEFTRIQDGRFNLSMELLDIESELEDTIFTYQELLRQDGMQLIYNPPEEEIPLVPGDPERLKQVFLNILDNAAKYARDGKTIEVSVFRTVKLLPFNLGTMAPASRKRAAAREGEILQGREAQGPRQRHRSGRVRRDHHPLRRYADDRQRPRRRHTGLGTPAVRAGERQLTS